MNTLDDITIKYGIAFNNNNLTKEFLSIFNSTELNINDYDLNNSDILNSIGLYYRKIKKNYEQMKKYFLPFFLF
jgi:ABC-type transport system involved in Fe-S cluster assembly fused permease/ATPase subunit